ncbi:MAG: thiamine phosphate synthase [Chloroflexi bacterium]|nr:thiamine phosphate synthase [Chloroflexota bacterium]
MTIGVARDFGLYVITDPGLSRGHSHREVVEAAVRGGATVIQLRDKQASTLDIYRLAVDLRDVCHRAGALLIINDRVDVAIAANTDGVHLGQDDLPAPAARKLLGPDKVLGVSVENPVHAIQAERDGADYVALGPIYEARGSKSDAGPPVGPEAIAAIRKATRLPVVAIGGIKHNHIAEVFLVGASGVAVISAIVAADNIERATHDMRELIDQARGSHARATRSSSGG